MSRLSRPSSSAGGTRWRRPGAGRSSSSPITSSPSARSRSPSARASGSTRPCLSSSAPAKPIRSRLFPTPSPAGDSLASGRPEEVLRHIEDALTFEKEDASAISASCMANVALGRFDEAVAAGEHGVAVAHRAPFFLGILGWALAAAGRDDEARTVLEELRAATSGLAHRRLRGLAARRARGDRRRLRRARTGGRGAPGPAVLHRIAGVRSAPRRPAVRGAAGEAGIDAMSLAARSVVCHRTACNSR